MSDQFTTIEEFFAQFMQITQKIPQKKIAQILALLLLIYIAYLCAQLTWVFAPTVANNPVNKTTQYSNNKKNHYQFNLADFQKLHLFGQYNQVAPQVEEVKDAPETTLNLTLTGVVASSQEDGGAAIIENSGKQNTYGVGEIIVGTRATLEKVYHDRVLIKQAGRLETLMLDGFKYQKLAARQISQPQGTKKSINKLMPNRQTGLKLNTKSDKKRAINLSNVKQQKIDQRDNKALSQRIKQLKQDIANNPSKISDYLRISPVRKGQKLVGYRLSPSKDKTFFQSSGLKTGDIAIQMNGLDLTEPSQAAQALKALREDTEVSLVVDRNGAIMEILFSIN